MRDEKRERRRYFRIRDEIYLEVGEISQEEYRRVQKEPPHERDDEPCDLILQLRALTSQGGMILAGIRKSHPEIAQYLAVHDKKIDLVARAIVGKQMEGTLVPNARVHLSAGGLAFHSETPKSADTPLLIRMVFFPSHLCVQAYGEVVHCERDETEPAKPFRVGVEFTILSEVARDALVRHTLERQAEERRKSRSR